MSGRASKNVGKWTLENFLSPASWRDIQADPKELWDIGFIAGVSPDTAKSRGTQLLC